MFTAVSVLIVGNHRHSVVHPSAEEEMGKMWKMHTIEYYAAVREARD